MTDITDEETREDIRALAEAVRNDPRARLAAAKSAMNDRLRQAVAETKVAHHDVGGRKVTLDQGARTPADTDDDAKARMNDELRKALGFT